MSCASSSAAGRVPAFRPFGRVQPAQSVDHGVTVGRTPTRVAMRILTCANDTSFEDQLIEGGEPEMVIGCNQSHVAEALLWQLVWSDCFILD